MGVKLYSNAVVVNVASAARASVVANIPEVRGRMIDLNLIDVTGDDASATLDFYMEERKTNCTGLAAAGTCLCLVGSTSGFSAGQSVLVQHPDASVQFSTIAAVGTSHLQFADNLTAAGQSRDSGPTYVHGIAKKMAVTVGATTKQIYGDGLVRLQGPCRLFMSAGTTASFNAIAGRVV